MENTDAYALVVGNPSNVSAQEVKEHELNPVYAALQHGHSSKFAYDMQSGKIQPTVNLSPEELFGMFFQTG